MYMPKRRGILAFAVTLIPALFAHGQTDAPQTSTPIPASGMEQHRAVRPWEFADAVGQQSALLGHEDGSFEAWVYPIKILRDLHLRFEVDKQSIDGSALVRSIETRPESTTITYAYDTFQVKETLFAPLHEQGLVIELQVNAAKPVGVSFLFHRDFELEWPATMATTDMEWSAPLHAFLFSESDHNYGALIGSQSAVDYRQEYFSYYASNEDNHIDLGTITGAATRTIAIAASNHGLPAAEATYRKLLSSYPQLLAESADYYRGYLNSHLQLELPDAALQQSFQWAQISTIQGLVENPYLGTGLIAGYGLSGHDGRPGFDWFFGRDALWTSLALNAEGDFNTTRTALTFLAKYQRSDGKITHEIAQTASLVPWFDHLPYAYAAADATPLFLIAMEDYVRRSGDIAFAREHWDNITRAWQFLHSTYDPNGFPRNLGVGHGWVEGGPLLPVKNEFYQAGLAVEAIRALDALAHSAGKQEELASLDNEAKQAEATLNHRFWIEEQHRYAYALDEKDMLVDAPSVLTAVPMWFHLLDEEKAGAMIEQLAGPELHTDWGMRILASTHPKYDPACYHCGTVWPLFTGWASVGEYRYHASLPAYANLRANALLAFDGSLGHTTEVLSGDYYQPLATGTPHQIWSSAMVISSMLSGLFGLDADAVNHHIALQPHLPADWTHFAMHHLQSGPCALSIDFSKTFDALTFTVRRESGSGCRLTLNPAVSLRAKVSRVEIDGHRAPFTVEPSALDQHVHSDIELSDSSPKTTIVFHLRNEFGITQNTTLPPLGSMSEGLQVVSQRWNAARDILMLNLASAGSGSYSLIVWNPDQIVSAEGATLTPGQLPTTNPQTGKLLVTVPPHAPGTFSHQQVILHFTRSSKSQ